MRRRFTVLGLASTLGIAVLTLGEAHATSYTFTAIDDPAGQPGTTYATDINNSGQIVGHFIDNTGVVQGFLDTNGVFTTISNPAASTRTSVSGINNAGQLVGSYVDGNGVTQGFVETNGVFTTISVLSATTTAATAINSNGDIVGYYRDFAGNHFFKDVAGVLTTIIDPSAPDALAFSINDAGQIAGYAGGSTAPGFVDTNGSFTNVIDPTPGVVSTYVMGINNSGEISGYYFDGANYFGYSLDANGNFSAVNDPAGNGADGNVHVHTLAYGNNDQGQIVGYYQAVDGYHGFLATPVPEPASMTVLGVGVVGLLMAGRRQQRRAAAVCQAHSSLGDRRPPPITLITVRGAI